MGRRSAMLVTLLAPVALAVAADRPGSDTPTGRLGDLRAVGTVQLRTSCRPEAQASFDRATALLHSFFYEEARRVFAEVEAKDVVILPAFGVSVSELTHLRTKGCVLVDTTCGSVLNVWKNVHRYARDGFTSVIHGKHYHEETKATASQALTHPGGHYLCVKDRPEAQLVCDFIRGGVEAATLVERFREATSPGFDPGRDLQKVGLANQTNRLANGLRIPVDPQFK